MRCQQTFYFILFYLLRNITSKKKEAIIIKVQTHHVEFLNYSRLQKKKNKSF